LFKFANSIAPICLSGEGGRLMRGDRRIEEAIEAGEKNKRAWELVRNWCANVQMKKFGGTGMVEQMTGLPIGNHFLECPHAPAGGMAAFDKGMAALGAAGGVLRAPSELSIGVVESALNELNLLAPLKKPQLIKACVATAMADDKLTLAEGELLRAICAALDSPLPPILETTEVVA